MIDTKLPPLTDKTFRVLIDNSFDVIALTNKEGVVTYISSSVKDVLGYDQADFIGKSGLQFIHPDDIPMFIKKFEDGKSKEQRRIRYECRIKDKSKNWRWVETISTNLLDDEHIQSVVTNLRDITYKKMILDKTTLSEIRYRTMIEQSPFSIQILAVDGRTVKVNKAWEKLWGVTLKDIQGYNILQDPQLESAGISKLIKKAFEGEAQTLPPIKYDPNKTLDLKEAVEFRWVRAFIYPIKDEEGQVKEIVLMHEDITEMKKTEDNLEKSEKLLQEIIDGSTAYIYIKDITGRYLLVNKQFANMFNVSHDAVKNITDYSLFPKEVADTLLENDKEIFEKGISLQKEEGIPMDDGVHTFLSIKFPLYEDSGKVYAVCGISTDITDRKELERRKDEFISIASHELKTPITTLMGFNQILKSRMQKNKNHEEELHYVGKMEDQLKRLTQLVNDLLDVSKIQSGKLRLNKEKLSLDELVKEVVEDISHIETKHEIVKKLDARKKLPFDKFRMSQVLFNLINNAIKYSPRADKVIVCTSQDKDSTILKVEDFGIGISKTDQAKIFDKFYQADTTIRKSFSGLGLGLFITQEIIKRHGGEISIESVRRKGSTFIVKLPHKD